MYFWDADFKCWILLPSPPPLSFVIVYNINSYTNTSACFQVKNDDFRLTLVVVVSTVQHIQVSSDFIQVKSDGRLNPATVVKFLEEKIMNYHFHFHFRCTLLSTSTGIRSGGNKGASVL